jgi:glutamate racemase
VYRYEATGENTAEFLRLARQLFGPQVDNVDYTPTGIIDLSHN